MTLKFDIPSVLPSDPSWWFSDALKAEGSIPSAPSLTGTVTVDVAIVGGGYTGLWTALELTQRAPHLSIALIEAKICGTGASGKNGGKANGFWGGLTGMESNLGADAALALGEAGSRAQAGMRAFAKAPGRDVWWKEAGNVKVSASPAQDAKIAVAVETAKRLGVSERVKRLSPDEVATFCSSPVFRGGVYYSEGATVHPGMLVRALRRAAMDAGVTIYENTPMEGVDAGSPNLVRTPRGELVTRDVVLAINVELAKRSDVGKRVSIFSSFALMTEPAPDKIAELG